LPGFVFDGATTRVVREAGHATRHGDFARLER
jgi:hypothetical protein